MLCRFPCAASMSCAVHAGATRFGSSHSIDRGRVVPTRSSLRVTSDVSSFLDSDRAGRYASEEPRTLPPSTRESRRLSTSRNAFLRQPSSRELGNDDGQSPLPFPALFRPKSVNLGLDHPTRPSRNRVSPHDRSATCRFLQAAESTSTPREPPSLAAAETFSVPAACLTAASHKAPGPRPELTLRKHLLCGPSRNFSEHARIGVEAALNPDECSIFTRFFRAPAPGRAPALG
jgi:hypothetical protein